MSNLRVVLQTTVREVLKNDLYNGVLLQEMDFAIRADTPTASIEFDKKKKKFLIRLGKTFFFETLTQPERVAVLTHELLHFSRGHLFRTDQMNVKKNIAMDMNINQYIKNLPTNCVNVSEWKLQDGSPFPTFQTWETYYKLINETTNKPPCSSEGSESCPNCGQSACGAGDSQPLPGESINYPLLRKYEREPMDDHTSWEDLSEEERKAILEEGANVMRRAIENSYKDFSLAPQWVKDMLLHIDTELRGLNCKQIFKSAVKRALPSPDRTNTWFRPNKRYGQFAPGTMNDKLPYINAYLDFSGSISHTEANGFLQTLNHILGEGQMRKCNLAMWHTKIFNFRKHRKNQPIKEDEIESGGTDPLCVFEHINKNNPNLSIIFTDGYYASVPVKLSNPVVFIISENGQVDHPYKHLGLTFKLGDLK